MVEIRNARTADVPGVLAIYNEVIASSTAIYRDEPATLEDRHEWLRARLAQGYPVLVAVDEPATALHFAFTNASGSSASRTSAKSASSSGAGSTWCSCSGF
jgi:L-amino acid N-acyltransferase YncA